MFRVNGFAQLLKHLPRGAFDQAVEHFAADKHRKGFSSWRQLVAMLYAQLSGAPSLRALEHSFNAHEAHHYHLGCDKIRRSTLAEANERGDGRVFHALAQHLMQQVHRRAREEGEGLLQLIDSTSITLKGPGFDAWTRTNRTRRTQGMKVHVLFGANEQAPLDCMMSAPNVNDLEYARGLDLEPGVTYVFDKAYCDYSWWWRMSRSHVRFISRLKRNARIQLRSERPIARAARGTILKDQQVCLSNKNPGAGRHNPYRAPLRRIEVARDGKPPLVLVTNDMKSSALRIAEHYKTRWQIELFFKWIKQHLKIKRFLGRSANAVRIQILSALIAYLLAYLHAKAHRRTDSLWLHLVELSSTLFQRPETELHRHRRWRERQADYELRQTVLFA
jgi:putative transposase